VVVARDGPSDPAFEVLGQAAEPLLRLGVCVLEQHASAQFVVYADLGWKPSAHFGQLGSSRRQGSVKYNLFSERAAPFWPEYSEAGDDLCIDPACYGARASARRKGLHLSRGPLAAMSTEEATTVRPIAADVYPEDAAI